jgi:hypothetical protein
MRKTIPMKRVIIIGDNDLSLMKSRASGHPAIHTTLSMAEAPKLIFGGSRKKILPI